MTGKRLIASGLVCAGLLGGVGVTGQIHADITQDSSATYNDTTDDSYSDIPDMGITVTNDVDDSTSDSNDTGSDTGDTTEDSNTDESTTTDTDQDSTNTDVTSNTDSSNTANSSSSTNGYATYESRNRLWDVINASVPILNRGNYYDDWSKIYTKKSYNNLDKGYHYGFKINKESNPTQADVDKAYDQLKKALSNLEKYKGSKEQKATIAKSKAKLLKTIKKAKSKTNKGYPKYRQSKYGDQDMYGGRYNYFRFQKMKKALKNASKLYKGSKASAKSLNKANKKLNSTLKNLIDQKEYYKAMKKYRAYDPFNYTIVSFSTVAMYEDQFYGVINLKASDFTQKILDNYIKLFYKATKQLKKHHWRKDTNKLWGKVNKKTGKFYYNRDRWGRKVTRYYYDKKDKHHKKPFSYQLVIDKKHETQYIIYRLDTNDMVALSAPK